MRQALELAAPPVVPGASSAALSASASLEAAASSAASAASSEARPSIGGERPSKRRRLGDASVLCMRELFRAVVKDGDVTEEERLVLQNTAVLLAQVDGKQW